MDVAMSLAALVIGSCVLAQDAVNPQTATLKDFEKRTTDYLNVQKNLAKGLSPMKQTTEPEKIIDRQHDLAQKLREARHDAKQGDIFTPDIAKEFRSLISLAMAGKNDTDVKKSLARAEPVRLTLHVNESYPAHVPLQSTPPTLLMNLPRLPTELEYRIVGHALVLRDSVANMVVDLIPDAIP
jgi:hypothetical protein